jgi:transposase
MDSGNQVARWRLYSRELKDALLAQCERVGALVARVAMEHGINANLVHSWRKRARGCEVVQRPVHEQFVPLALPAAMASDAVIVVQLQRGAVAAW